MTKAREAELLDETIKKFGPDSYIGPWLAEYREQILSDMRSDFSISAPMPRAAQEISVRILLEAGDECERITKSAEANRQRIIDAAHAERERIKADALRKLEAVKLMIQSNL